jgi:hypothetical protein
VHAYLFAMIAALWIADLARRLLVDLRRTWLEPLAVGGTIAALMLSTGVWSGPAAEAQGGFGWFKMNALSLIDPNPWVPSLMDKAKWSLVLPDIPNWGGDYEGFAYVGLGGLLLAAVAAWCSPAVRAHLRRPPLTLHYAPLALVLVGMGVFALSQNVTFAEKNFYLWWPAPLQMLGEIFRSTGRFVWPLYYVMFFAAVFIIARRLSPRALAVVLGSVAIVQAVDVAPGWLEDREYLHVRGGLPTPLTAPFWSEAAERYDAVRLAPHRNSHPDFVKVASFAFAHGLPTDAVYLSRTSTPATEASQARMEAALATGVWPSDTLFILDDETAGRARATLDPSRNVLARVDGLIVLAPEWRGCSDCGAEPYR